MPELFELNPEKIEVGLTVRKLGQPFRVVHELRRPEEDDWLNYDKRLSTAIEDVEEDGTRIVDNSLEASCLFWDDISLAVQAYGPKDAPLPENFRKLVPPDHKRAAIQQLLNVGASISEAGQINLFLSSDEEVVRLRAVREQVFANLVHYFKPPSTNQRIAYDRCLADSYVIRGRKNGKDRVVIPARMKRLIRFYDDLIIRVDGYCVKGNIEFLADVESIRRFMDAKHKEVAVQLLFGGGEEIQPDLRVEKEEKAA